MACLKKEFFSRTIYYWLGMALSLSGCSSPSSSCVPVSEYEYSPGCEQNTSVTLEYRECEGLIAWRGEQLLSSTDFGATWETAQKQEIFPHGITDDGCHPLNHNVRYRTLNEHGMPFPVGVEFLEKSTDSGKTWIRQRAKLDYSDFSLIPRAIYYDHKDPNTIYIQAVQVPNVIGKETFCVSHDGGDTFRPILSIKGNLFAVSPSDPNILYAADFEGNVLRSTDAGKQWSTVLDGPKMKGVVVANAIRHGIIRSKYDMRGFRSVALTVDPKSSATAYIVTEYGILKTTDGGQTWCGIKAKGLAGATFDLLIDPNDTKILCLGTECGLFRSTNGGKDWEEINLLY